MAATSYTYAISTAFPNARVDGSRLESEIDGSAITIALARVDTAGDTCTIYFKDELSAEEQTTLTSLVAAHSGEPLVEPVETLVSLNVPQTSDGKPIFQPSMFPGGVYLYVTGTGDDATLGRGKGQALELASDVAGDTTIEFNFIDWIYLSSGGIAHQGAEFGDWLTCEFYAPATPVTPTPGTGNANLVPPSAGAPSILLVPAAGNGAYTADLTRATPVPAFAHDGSGNGYWDWSEPDTGFGAVSASATPGKANWHLFAAPIPLVRFVNRFPLLGSGSMDLNPPAIKAKKMLPHWKGKLVLHNSGHVGLQIAIHLSGARAQTL